MASATANTVKLNLLIDKKRNVILYAEAGKSFVDFIIHILQLPMETVIRLISEIGTVGSMGNLYNNVLQTLNETWFLHSDDKSRLSSLKSPSYGGGLVESLLLPQATEVEPPNSYYSFLSGKVSVGGYVKETKVPYMVMDNLVVTSFSSILLVTFINQLKLSDGTEVEERVVDFGYEEAVKLLKALLVSTTVLTDVFLGQEKKDYEEVTYKVYCKADPNYLLTIRGGNVVLAPSDSIDPYQQWYKDEKFSTIVKDEEGFPCFSLINKATGQVMKQYLGTTHPVELSAYSSARPDQTVLWTAGEDLGDGYRAIRIVNNVRINLDAFRAIEEFGGVQDGTVVGLWKWNKGHNQLWKITPY